MGKAYHDIKKKIKKMIKHLKKNDGGCFGGSGSCKIGNRFANNNGMPPNGWGWYPPFFRWKSPWCVIFLCPKAIVLYIILIVLLLCGVSFYGLVILVLLTIIFILI
ncbi:MAG: hypothetical protein E7207_04345 [Clostridium butyricum]|nr:hypothetical protein [Clostridium butyricum]